MTTVFVYEYCCALGLGREPSDPAHSLYREGRAMRDAVLEDFRRMPMVRVTTLDDVGEPVDEFDEVFTDEIAFRRAAAASDFAVLIAPELNGLLLTRANWACEEGCSLLTPSAQGIRRTTDKLWLAGHWENNQVPTPFTTQIEYWPADRWPAVIKPREGVGSLAIGSVRRAEDAVAVVALLHQDYEGQLIAQDFVPGRAASVAFLVGPKITVPLLPAYQRLSIDGRFRYEGGDLPILPELAERALSLGRRAVECVPGLRGYVGVDLILGEADDGSQDVAIEINPRLTTSYVGTRQLADFNMAEAMLRVARGELVELRWKPGRVRFDPDGTVDCPRDRE